MLPAADVPSQAGPCNGGNGLALVRHRACEQIPASSPQLYSVRWQGVLMAQHRVLDLHKV